MPLRSNPIAIVWSISASPRRCFLRKFSQANTTSSLLRECFKAFGCTSTSNNSRAFQLRTTSVYYEMPRIVKPSVNQAPSLLRQMAWVCLAPCNYHANLQASAILSEKRVPIRTTTVFSLGMACGKFMWCSRDGAGVPLSTNLVCPILKRPF